MKHFVLGVMVAGCVAAIVRAWPLERQFWLGILCGGMALLVARELSAWANELSKQAGKDGKA